MKERSIKILIADDDSGSLHLLKSILLEKKFKIFEAASGEEALDFLEKQDVDLVISDLQISGMSEGDFINELRQWDSQVPIISVGGVGKGKDWLESVHSNANAFLSKPLQRGAILKTVRAVVRTA